MASIRQPDGAGTGVAGLVSLTNKAYANPPDHTGELLVSQEEMRLRRMSTTVRTRARLVEEIQNPDHQLRAAMLTLTYRDVDGWSARHIRAFNTTARNYCMRQGYRLPYTWVAELQKRGAVHFHEIVWLPPHLTLPKPDKAGWWPHGMTKVEWADNAVAYLTKYISKTRSAGTLPKGLRLHGGGGMTPDARKTLSWACKPQYVRDRWHISDLGDARIIPAAGGGWLNTETGEVVRSSYEFAGRSNGFVRLRLRQDAPTAGDECTADGTQDGRGGELPHDDAAYLR